MDFAEFNQAYPLLSALAIAAAKREGAATADLMDMVVTDAYLTAENMQVAEHWLQSLTGAQLAELMGGASTLWVPPTSADVLETLAIV